VVSAVVMKLEVFGVSIQEQLVDTLDMGGLTKAHRIRPIRHVPREGGFSRLRHFRKVNRTATHSLAIARIAGVADGAKVRRCKGIITMGGTHEQVSGAIVFVSISRRTRHTLIDQPLLGDDAGAEEEVTVADVRLSAVRHPGRVIRVVLGLSK